MIRTMIKDDLDDVVNLTANIMPNAWSNQAFLSALSSPQSAWVLLIKNTILGFAVTQMSAGVVEILNIGVALKFQSKGYGSQLMAYALQSIDTSHIDKVWLELRESNIRAYHLYKKFGFKLVGMRKDYYSKNEGREGALLMELIIP